MKLGALFAVTAQAAVPKKLLFQEQQALGDWPFDWAAEECQANMYPDKRVISQPEVSFSLLKGEFNPFLVLYSRLGRTSRDPLARNRPENGRQDEE